MRLSDACVSLRMCVFHSVQFCDRVQSEQLGMKIVTLLEVK